MGLITPGTILNVFSKLKTWVSLSKAFLTVVKRNLSVFLIVQTSIAVTDIV